jgi:diguanylate cyclase (GGDEF)-like protein
MGARILVVEDDGEIARDLERMLGGLGYSVCGAAATGDEALRQALVEVPDLVLMDVQLQGAMDGIQAARIIRDRSEVPVIFATAHSDDATLGRALEAAPAAFLLKPFGERSLRTAIEVALHQHSAGMKLRERLERESTVDALTGLFNRRHLEVALEQEMLVAARRQLPVSVLMLDVDHFKRFNDAHGHPAGDAALRAVGALLRSALRPRDIACRYGGEELTVILPGTPEADAWVVAERLRAAVAALELRLDGVLLPSVTVSIGVAGAREGATPASMLRAADAALYRAKELGRDRTVAAE